MADAGEVEQVADQAFHRATGFCDPLEEMRAALAEGRAEIFTQQTGETEHRDERRAKVVSERAHRLLQLVVLVGNPQLGVS